MPLKHKKDFNFGEKKGTKRQRAIARQEARRVLNNTTETKHFFGRTLGYVGGTYSGQTINLFTNPATGVNLVQGDDRDQYNGDTINPIFLGLKYQIECLSGTFNSWTILVIQVKGGGSPSPTDVLQSVSNSQTPFSFLDPEYADTYKVLARRTVTAQFQQGTQTKSGYIKIPSKRLRKVHMIVPNSTAAANGLFVVFYCDTLQSTVGLQMVWDIAYKDA